MGGCKDCDAPQQIAVHILSVRLQEGLEVGHFDWDGHPGGCSGVDGGQGIVGCQGKDVIPGKIRPGPLEDIWIDPECAPWPVVFHYQELKNLRPFGLIVLFQSVVAFSQNLSHFK